MGHRDLSKHLRGFRSMKVKSLRCWRKEAGVSDTTCKTFILVFAILAVDLGDLWMMGIPSDTPRIV